MEDIPETILALDVGSGTQDLLLWRSGEVMENCIQMVLPSPTTLLSRRVRRMTEERLPLHLSGHLMGGGPVSWAIRDHAAAGFPVTAEPQAALTLHDNLDHVREMGVIVQESPLDGAVRLSMGDIQRETLESTLAEFGYDPPELWCVAVQDHGFHPMGSNRTFRFDHWKAFLQDGGVMAHTLYTEPPNYLTRMQAVLAQVPRGRVMDTGMAGIHGAFCDQTVRAHLAEGVMVVNVGNQHTLAALATEDQVWGLFEHHTGALSRKVLKVWLEKFRKGELLHEEALNDGGHGCAYRPEGIPDLPFKTVAITGPQRQMARGFDWTLAAPFGNMMLTGCYGLIRGVHLAAGSQWP